MAVESWEPSSNIISYDEEIYDDNENVWTREISGLQTPEPSAQESFKAFMEQMIIFKDIKTKLVTIGVKHQSPFIAKQWADLLQCTRQSQASICSKQFLARVCGLSEAPKKEHLIEAALFGRLN